MFHLPIILLLLAPRILRFLNWQQVFKQAKRNSVWELTYCSYIQYYRCILLIPDIYNKQHVKELVNMILMKMGFSGKTLQKQAQND